ncbi:MAG TPA: MBOAT family protein [Candidatus Margulisiibacteriota bacterium]|nr:MBOAT family protein [Candidatus Margulisiibacteriota bacterium]
MLFNSLAFLVFLPSVLIVLGVVPRRWRNPCLLAAGYFFYGCWDWRFLGLLALSTVIDFSAGQLMARSVDAQWRKLVLVCSISANLVILGFFKYFNFFADSFVGLMHWCGLQVSAPMLSVVLPVGISFYTFQSMSYAIDVYRRATKPAEHFLDYATYVAYFPQLVAGPIERAGHLLPQIVSPARVTPERINIGLTLMMLGYIKKVLIADQLALQVDQIFANAGHLSSGVLLRGAYLFTFQIYCDFSGYSDIARGVSELLGIRLRLNFNQPYLSQSITEFWRRWHMSLSAWLRDYLYIPLGGNRHGALMTYRNLMLTMLIGGLWHGANWTFVVWGGLHGSYLVIERLLGIGRRQAPSSPRDVAGWAWRIVCTLLTFHLAAFAWIFFRAPDFTTAFAFISGLFHFTHLRAIGVVPFLVAAAVLAIDIPQNAAGDHTVFLRLPWWVQAPAYATACFAILLWGGGEVPFIYFQF